MLSDPFLCCFLGLCFDYCTVGRSKHGLLKDFLQSQSLIDFYLLVFLSVWYYIIHDVMCLNKMSIEFTALDLLLKLLH